MPKELEVINETVDKVTERKCIVAVAVNSNTWVQPRMVLVVIFFSIFLISFLVGCCYIRPSEQCRCYIPLPSLLKSYGNLFRNMSDTRETGSCCFTGITHITEKISRCY